ncbi:MAG: outer membrane beta-barrel protein [Syntrophales bacterium]|jgi:opacity protein-like surface antigen|nr:outer membrane beta-barrel protein [Syntrophales bacterium]
MKKMFSCVLVLALSGMLFFAPPPAATAAEAGPFYVGLFGGYVMPDDLENGADISLDNSWALGVKGGYIVPAFKWLAVELEYAYLAEQDLDQAGYAGDFKASNLMLNFVLRYPEGKFHPYIGAGIGWSWGELNVTGPGGAVDDTDNALAWQLLLGVNFEITRNWSADLSYRYLRAEYEFGSGGSDTTSTNHMFLIGVNFHF